MIYNIPLHLSYLSENIWTIKKIDLAINVPLKLENQSYEYNFSELLLNLLEALKFKESLVSNEFKEKVKFNFEKTQNPLENKIIDQCIFFINTHDHKKARKNLFTYFVKSKIIFHLGLVKIRYEVDSKLYDWNVFHGLDFSVYDVSLNEKPRCSLNRYWRNCVIDAPEKIEFVLGEIDFSVALKNKINCHDKSEDFLRDIFNDFIPKDDDNFNNLLLQDVFFRSEENKKNIKFPVKLKSSVGFVKEINVVFCSEKIDEISFECLGRVFLSHFFWCLGANKLSDLYTRFFLQALNSGLIFLRVENEKLFLKKENRLSFFKEKIISFSEGCFFLKENEGRFLCLEQGLVFEALVDKNNYSIKFIGWDYFIKNCKEEVYLIASGSELKFSDQPPVNLYERDMDVCSNEMLESDENKTIEEDEFWEEEHICEGVASDFQSKSNFSKLSPTLFSSDDVSFRQEDRLKLESLFELS